MPDDDREYYSTVLVVESDPEVRSTVVGALRNYGFAVLAVSNGEWALRTADRQKSPVKVLIVGTRLPDTEGAELAETLRTIHPGARTILIGPDRDAERSATSGPRPGPHAFLTTPIDTGALLEAVWGALGPEEGEERSTDDS